MSLDLHSSLLTAVDHIHKRHRNAHSAGRTTEARFPVNHAGFTPTVSRSPHRLWTTPVALPALACSPTSEDRPHANENRPSGPPDATNEGSAVASMPIPARPDDPVPLAECITELASHLRATQNVED